MTNRRAKDREAASSKANLGQKEAKQEALSKEQFSHMKGGKVADSLEQQKTERTGQTLVTSFARLVCGGTHPPHRMNATAQQRNSQSL